MWQIELGSDRVESYHPGLPGSVLRFERSRITGQWLVAMVYNGHTYYGLNCIVAEVGKVQLDNDLKVALCTL